MRPPTATAVTVDGIRAATTRGLPDRPAGTVEQDDAPVTARFGGGAG